MTDRQYYFNNEFDNIMCKIKVFGPVTYQREEACHLDIWVKCFNKNKADLDKAESNAISLITTQIPEWEKINKSKVTDPYSKQRNYARKKVGTRTTKKIYNKAITEI